MRTWSADLGPNPTGSVRVTTDEGKINFWAR
jgi:hypothetical protein